MPLRRRLLLALAVVVLSPLPVLAAPPAADAAAPSARARLLDAQGKEVGTATFEPAPGGIGVRINVKVSGLKPGEHGFHIHAVAKCEPPDFKSAGPHFNPSGMKHGYANPDGPHAGDLPNILVSADGKGEATVIAKSVTIDPRRGPSSLFEAEGTSLVVHADPDDGKTDPAGNSGARIACGVIERAK